MKLEFYMKSGNVITQGFVKDWRIKYSGNEITELMVEYSGWAKWFGDKLLIKSVDLSQIEAIVRG